MAGNKALGAAKGAKQDEFYTQLTDIEKELRYYRKHFRGKTVLCNCDDPFESNFFRFFVMNFNKLGLKKLIATCYTSSPIIGTQLSLFDVVPEAEPNTPYKAIVTKVYDVTGDGATDMHDVAELFKSGENELAELEGDGDFRSKECLALLKEADIVVTNPPFSLFREYVTMLVEYDKRFVIIGPNSGCKYKETFPLICDGKMWLGYTTPKEFIVPCKREDRNNTIIREDGTILAKFGNVYWFTNLDINKRHEEMILVKRYSSDTYFSYTNFDGIDVPSVAEIPCDYSGNMGVPISFLEQHNPDQFEIVGLGEGDLAKEINITRNHEGRTKLEYQTCDGEFKRPYARLVIRNKHPEKPKEKK